MAQQIHDLGTLHGPVLVFGGSYSNLPALEALRTVAEDRGIPPTNVICTGDIVAYCAEPQACLDLVRDWGIPAITGNVELNLREGVEDCGCNFSPDSRCDLFARLWYPYARKHVTEAGMTFLRELPEFLRFEYAGRRGFVLHGSYGYTAEFIFRSTDWSRKAEQFAATESDLILAGHCGLPFVHQTADQQWINAGVIGMPANDGTPRTWYALLREGANGPEVTFHTLAYDYATTRERMRGKPLPISYVQTLANGIWDNNDILPAEETTLQGRALDPELLLRNATGESQMTEWTAPLTQPKKNPKMDKQYFDPSDLKKFGRISEFQEEMGEQFFQWYENVTGGDTALTSREKSLIALAVSHAIACPYCIDAWTQGALSNGADEEQMMEAVHVAAAIRAGTTMIHSLQMVKQVDKLSM